MTVITAENVVPSILARCWRLTLNQDDSWKILRVTDFHQKKSMKYFRNIQLQLSWGEEAAAKWRHWHLSKESGFALLLLLMVQKSCTRWYGKYPIIHRVWYIPSGAELLSSTVWATDFLPEEKLGVVDQSALELPQSDCRSQLES